MDWNTAFHCKNK